MDKPVPCYSMLHVAIYFGVCRIHFLLTKVRENLNSAVYSADPFPLSQRGFFAFVMLLL